MQPDDTLLASAGPVPAVPAIAVGADRAVVRRWTLLAVLVVLNALDVLTTHLVLQNGGEERNPVMKPVMDELAHGAGVKVLALLVVALLLARCSRPSRCVDLCLAGVCGWYGFVVLWNVTVLARLV